MKRNHVEFYLWGDHYTVRFQYNRDYDGHPWQTLAWIDKWNPIMGRWYTEERVASNGMKWFDPGKAEVRKGTPNKDKGRKIALARALHNLGWCKYDRAVVWDAYLDFFYPLYKGDGLTDLRPPMPARPLRVTSGQHIITSVQLPDGTLTMDVTAAPF